MAQKQDFSGKWLFRHWYPSADDLSEESQEYEMIAHQKNDHIVLQSVKKDQHDSYMLARLNVDGKVAIGSWYEDASVHGPFKGAQYSGTGQLIIDDSGNRMDGIWAGAGLDRSLNELRIYTGRWEFVRL